MNSYSNTLHNLILETSATPPDVGADRQQVPACRRKGVRACAHRAQAAHQTQREVTSADGERLAHETETEGASEVRGRGLLGGLRQLFIDDLTIGVDGLSAFDGTTV